MDLPSHLKFEISRSNPRGSTCCRLCSYALGSRATDVLKGKKSGDPTVPARGISSGTTGRGLPMYWSACPLLVSRKICQTTKVELSKSQRETRCGEGLPCW